MEASSLGPMEPVTEGKGSTVSMQRPSPLSTTGTANQGSRCVYCSDRQAFCITSFTSTTMCLC